MSYQALQAPCFIQLETDGIVYFDLERLLSQGLFTGDNEIFASGRTPVHFRLSSLPWMVTPATQKGRIGCVRGPPGHGGNT